MRYDVRWSRRDKRFVFKDESGHEEPLVELYGYSRMTGADNENLHLIMDNDDLSVEDEIGTGILEDQTVEVPEDAEFLGRCKWRICARRNNGDFRFRDEANGGRLWFTPRFEGVAHWAWDDHKSHLFHEGDGYLLKNGNILLVP